MQFGNLGRICSSRPFERQPQELPGKNNSFLPLIITNICDCTKQPINGITIQLKRNAWDGTQDDARRSRSPLTCAKQRNITSKNANTIRLWCSGIDVADRPAAFVRLSLGTDRLRHPHQWRRYKISPIRFALLWTRMLSLPVQQGTAAEHTRTNTHTDLPETTPTAEVHHNSTASAAIDSVFSPCSVRRWPCVLCQTLHPLRHDARSEGELHGTGARPGGWPSGFLLMEDRIKQQRNGREGTHQFPSPHELCCGCDRWRANGAFFFFFSFSGPLKFCTRHLWRT